MRLSTTLRSGRLREDIARTLAMFVEAERSSNAELAQRAYEDLFILCYRNDLELNSLLDEVETDWCDTDPGWPARLSLGSSPSPNRRG